MKRPRRKRPNPAHSPAYVPYFAPPKTFRHAVPMLLLGLLLTMLTVVLMIHRVELRNMLRTVTAVTVQAAPAAMPKDLPAQEEREYWRRESEKTETAQRTLGFLHTLALPFIGYVLLRDLVKRSENELSPIKGNLSGYLAMIGIGLIYINCFILLWRFVYYPVVDWIWEALGNRIIEYENARSSRFRGRARMTAYQNGGSLGLLFMFGVALLWLGVKKLGLNGATGADK